MGQPAHNLEIDFPREFLPMLEPRRLKVYFGGRGGCKSWTYAILLVLKAYREKNLRILCAREFQGSIRESVHRLLADTIERLGLSWFFRIEQQGIHGKNGSHFFFAGLKNNISAVKSVENISVVWAEEAESITDNSWDTLIPTIRAPGSEIWISFNPQSETDSTYERYIMPYLQQIEADGHYTDDRIHVQKVGFNENPWFPDELRMEMEACKRDNPNKYQHIWLGNPKSAVEGAIYGDQMQAAQDDGRITDIPIETSVPVDTFFDLGRNDTTAIWFMQRVGLEHRFIDCYESRLVGLDHYAKILREKDYMYGEHYLPHDVEVHELSNNTTRLETLMDLGVKPITVVPRIRNINEGIEQTRQKFASCWFDRTRCADGLKALRSYQYTWDERFSVFREKPLHNHASNYSDAFRQFGQGYAPTGGAFDTSKFYDKGVR